MFGGSKAMLNVASSRKTCLPTRISWPLLLNYGHFETTRDSVDASRTLGSSAPELAGSCLDAERPPEGGLSQKLPNRFTPFVASTSLPVPCSAKPFRVDATSAFASVFLLPCSHFRFRFRVPTSVFPLPLSLPCSQVQFRLELIMMVDRSPGQPTNSCFSTRKTGPRPATKETNHRATKTTQTRHLPSFRI